MISEKDYNEIYLKGYEDGKKDNNNLKITYAIKPSFTTRKLEKLQQENKKLNGAIQTYDILLKANTEENKRLKDNWNKLKEWASNFYNSEEVGWAGCGMRYTLEKMQELEGSDK